jgi:hypothetical protein
MTGNIGSAAATRRQQLPRTLAALGLSLAVGAVGAAVAVWAPWVVSDPNSWTLGALAGFVVVVTFAAIPGAATGLVGAVATRRVGGRSLPAWAARLSWLLCLAGAAVGTNHALRDLQTWPKARCCEPLDGGRFVELFVSDFILFSLPLTVAWAVVHVRSRVSATTRGQRPPW